MLISFLDTVNDTNHNESINQWEQPHIVLASSVAAVNCS